MLLLLMGLASTTQVVAESIYGVQLNQKVTLDSNELVLNGAGPRKKLFIVLYVASLYLQEHNTDAADIIKADKPMMLQIDLVSDLVTRKQLVKVLKSGFRKHAGQRYQELRPGMDRLIELVSKPVKPGDQLKMSYNPARGTAVMINNEVLGRIEGLDFKQVFFSMYLAEKPAQESLKKALLRGKGQQP